MNWKHSYAFIASLFMHGVIIGIFPHVNTISPPKPEPITRITLIEQNYYEQIDLVSKTTIYSLAEEISVNMRNKREEALLEETRIHTPDIVLPKQIYKENTKIIVSDVMSHSSKDYYFDDQQNIYNKKEDEDKLAKNYTTSFKPRSFFKNELAGSRKPIWLSEQGRDIGKDQKRKSSSYQRKDFFKEELPGEKVEDKPKIEWEGDPRTLLYAPAYHSSYQGQIEGEIQLRFWVDKSGHVTKIIPIKKLNHQLEEDALKYITYYRFERSDTYDMQEGIITITFRLD